MQNIALLILLVLTVVYVFYYQGPESFIELSPAMLKPKKEVPLEDQEEQEEDKTLLPKCVQDGAFISSNLLPKDDVKLDDFAEFSPANMLDNNFIDATRYVVGAQSQSLRNSNQQLRSEPINPKKNVCPWLQSTIEPDTLRRPLEINACDN